ncbi:hypothetical protein [Actinomadura opuntiae]|uniref:hypothetical protein n=1 Tax=Actinomadura sp. OS1-43 TaxID=604315 RepID=UPI00255A89A9|nr:hypothetical protein [Actinomadura sp. OS1-43]MDL4815833.1 hypothetical protein [Actinomadura sp. OS1-43]
MSDALETPVSGTAVPVDGIGPRWTAARKAAGYGAALSLSLYLAVKVVWVGAALLGHTPSNFGDGDWIVLNTVTVGMSVVGVVLGLGLAQRWGRRVPAPPLVFCAWTGAGFLIPMIPYMVLSAFVGGDSDGGGSGGGSGGGDAAPSWEMVFIGVGFAGMAVGLAVGLPIYMRERWPAAFLGRVDDRGPAHLGRYRLGVLYGLVAALALLWTYWAAGGTLGLEHRDMMDANGRLLVANSALWAVMGAAAIRTIAAGRSRIPLWIPMALGFTASGSMFAWAAWKLPWALIRPGGYTPVEYVGVSLIEYGLSITAGIVMLAALLKAARPTSGLRSLPR